MSVSDTSTSQGNDHSIPNPGPLPNSPSADKQNALNRNIYREALEERFGKDGLPKRAYAVLDDFDGDGVKDLIIIYQDTVNQFHIGPGAQEQEPDVRTLVFRHKDGKAELVDATAGLLRLDGRTRPNKEIEVGVAEYDGELALFIIAEDGVAPDYCWSLENVNSRGNKKNLVGYNGLDRNKLKTIVSVYYSRNENNKMLSQRSLEEVLKEADDVTNLISTKAKENDVKTGSNTENASAPGTDATVTKPDISAIVIEQIASAKSPAGLPDKEKRDYSDNTSNSGAETWNAPVIYSNPYEQPKGTEDDPWGTAGAVYSIDPISGEIVVTYPDGENDETNGFEYPDPFWEPVFGDFNDSGESVDGSDETPDAETGYGNSILDYLFSLAG